MVERYGYHKSDKCNDKSCSCKRQHIEKLIICTRKLRIDIGCTTDIEDDFDKRRDIKNLLVDKKQYNQKKDIDEWKKSHAFSIGKA